MVTLGLSPLPVSGPEGESQPPVSAGWEDFVTDEAVCEVVGGCSSSRLPVLFDDLALSSSEEDFAGILVNGISSAAAVRSAPAIEWPEVEEAPTAIRVGPAPGAARARPPEFHELESSSKRVSGSGHRWWIPGLAGVAATMVIAAVVFAMSNGAAPLTGLLSFPKPEPLEPPTVVDPTPIAPEGQSVVASASRLAP